MRLEIADDDVLRAIADQAERMNQTIRSIAVFDGAPMRAAAALGGACAQPRSATGSGGRAAAFAADLGLTP